MPRPVSSPNGWVKRGCLSCHRRHRWRTITGTSHPGARLRAPTESYDRVPWPAPAKSCALGCDRGGHGAIGRSRHVKAHAMLRHHIWTAHGAGILRQADMIGTDLGIRPDEIGLDDLGARCEGGVAARPVVVPRLTRFLIGSGDHHEAVLDRIADAPSV